MNYEDKEAAATKGAVAIVLGAIAVGALIVLILGWAFK